MADYSITQGAELPPLQRSWLDADGNAVDLSIYTLTLRIGTDPPIEKTSGVTGDVSGNVTISWAAGELNAVPVGVYSAQVWARDGSSLDRVMDLSIEVQKQVATP